MNSTVLIVPGLRDHVPDHWQTLLAQELPDVRTVRVAPADKLKLDIRIAAIQAELERIEGPVIVVAHSGGVVAFVAWAQRHARRIKGALLATPADLDSPLPKGYPTPAELSANGWRGVPRARLRFASIVAASTNDPLAKPDRIAQMAKDWGSALVDIGAAGHLNPASGYGPWPRAHDFIAALERGNIVPPG